MQFPKAFANVMKGSKSGLSGIAFAGYGIAVLALGLTAMMSSENGNHDKPVGQGPGSKKSTKAGQAPAPVKGSITGSPSLSSTQQLDQLAQAKTFAAFIIGLKRYGARQRLDPALLAQIFDDMKVDEDIIRFTTSQPEHARAPWEYVGALVSDKRIADGREMLAKHGADLEKIEAAYGVDRHIVMAIWGVESSYGSGQGGRNVLRSLASLAFLDKRRAAFWRKQLMAALKIVANGDIAAEAMTGSWAGAMGHTQFMPTTYLAHAVDFDGDGKRNIWSSVADALASTAAYLKASKWGPGLTWGREVVLPQNFDYGLSAPGNRKTAGKWQSLGVQLAEPGAPLPDGEAKLGLLLPAGNRGPAFLVSANFKSILRYNHSNLYALSVGHLADRLAQGPQLKGSWPVELKPLAKDQRIEMQRLLTARGLDTGGIDGILGRRSQAAIRSFQSVSNLPADGFATVDLLDRLRGGSASGTSSTGGTSSVSGTSSTSSVSSTSDIADSDDRGVGSDTLNAGSDPLKESKASAVKD